MNWEKFDNNCPDCKPVLVDPTGRVLPDHSPEMRAVLKIWKETTLPQRRAWHRLTCQGSCDQDDRETVRPFLNAMGEALERVVGQTPRDPENN